jgi:hypothetical protein
MAILYVNYTHVITLPRQLTNLEFTMQAAVFAVKFTIQELTPFVPFVGFGCGGRRAEF